MNEIVVQNLIIIASLFNYIFTSIALFKISKMEKIGKPWFAWIPVLNDYLLIKLGKGKIWFVILAAVPVVIQMIGFDTGIIGTIITAAWLVYKINMYMGICDRYNVSILIFTAGFMFQLTSVMTVRGTLVRLLGILVIIVGHSILYIKARKGIQVKTIVESKVTFSKLNKKKKSVK